jgi:beta-1,4-N-acetylglucosaminyltransferase
MIFLAVGTQFGFDRLVKAIDEAVEKKLIQDEIFAQIGPGQYRPVAMKYVVNLEKEEFDKTFNSCSAMISHAGMGNISLALKTGKPLLVMPRLKQYGEVVNNHQVDTARKFEQYSHVLVAYNEEELLAKIKLLNNFTPRKRIPNHGGVINRINGFLKKLSIAEK